MYTSFSLSNFPKLLPVLFPSLPPSLSPSLLPSFPSSLLLLLSPISSQLPFRSFSRSLSFSPPALLYFSPSLLSLFLPLTISISFYLSFLFSSVLSSLSGRLSLFSHSPFLPFFFILSFSLLALHFPLSLSPSLLSALILFLSLSHTFNHTHQTIIVTSFFSPHISIMIHHPSASPFCTTLLYYDYYLQSIVYSINLQPQAFLLRACRVFGILPSSFTLDGFSSLHGPLLLEPHHCKTNLHTNRNAHLYLEVKVRSYIVLVINTFF